MKRQIILLDEVPWVKVSELNSGYFLTLGLLRSNRISGRNLLIEETREVIPDNPNFFWERTLTVREQKLSLVSEKKIREL